MYVITETDWYHDRFVTPVTIGVTIGLINIMMILAIIIYTRTRQSQNFQVMDQSKSTKARGNPKQRQVKCFVKTRAIAGKKNKGPLIIFRRKCTLVENILAFTFLDLPEVSRMIIDFARFLNGGKFIPWE